jgi:hypothetical protein
MSTISSMQGLAFFATTHLGEHRSPGERDTPSTFEVVVETYAHEGNLLGREGTEARACEQVMALLPEREAPGDDLQVEVESYVHQSLQFLEEQYPDATDVEPEQHLLAILFSAHLEQAAIATAAR